jgi:hypothetical protein
MVWLLVWMWVVRMVSATGAHGATIAGPEAPAGLSGEMIQNVLMGIGVVEAMTLPV